MTNCSFAVRPLSPDVLIYDLLADFQHCQLLTQKWIKNGENWKIASCQEMREWSSEKRVWIAEYLYTQIARGGAAFGAFFQDRMVGFCCVDGMVKGSSAAYANLTMLFVDDRWQRYGIGRALFGVARQFAAHLGAEKLFISAIPSVETIAFYFSMGCMDCREIIPEFVDSENDRFLESTLNILPFS